MVNDVWLVFNRIRWAVARRSVAMSEAELRALGDEHFLKAEDVNVQARWTEIKERSEAEGRSLAEICDDVVKDEDDPGLLLISQDFTCPQLSASRWITAHVANRLEAWREHPSKYIRSLEELLFSVDNTARETGDAELYDLVGAGSHPYQSIFCATVINGIRSRRNSSGNGQ